MERPMRMQVDYLLSVIYAMMVDRGESEFTLTHKRYVDEKMDNQLMAMVGDYEDGSPIPTYIRIEVIEE